MSLLASLCFCCCESLLIPCGQVSVDPLLFGCPKTKSSRMLISPRLSVIVYILFLLITQSNHEKHIRCSVWFGGGRSVLLLFSPGIDSIGQTTVKYMDSINKYSTFSDGRSPSKWFFFSSINMASHSYKTRLFAVIFSILSTIMNSYQKNNSVCNKSLTRER